MPGSGLPHRIRTIVELRPLVRISRTQLVLLIALCATLCATFFAASLTRAQDAALDSEKAAGSKTSFEAASVKRAAPGTRSRRFGILSEPGGRLTANNATLQDIVRTAYGLDPQQMITAPEFDRLLAERFDIEAKAADNSTEEQRNLMFRSLLADRFKLLVHHETRPLSVFALVLSKPGKIGPQLIQHTDNANCPDQSIAVNPSVLSSIPCGNMIMGRGRVTANKISIADFAASLSGTAGRLVQDRTGLPGTFDLTLKYTPEQQTGYAPGPDAVTPDPLGPSLFTALQEQLGLKLDSQVAPVDVVVIDHVEEPTPN